MTSSATSATLVLPIKPIIKVAGGKTWALPKLAQVVRNIAPSPSHYYEPFFGGGALYWHLWSTGSLNTCESITISDASEDLMQMYREIQGDCTTLISSLSKLASLYAANPLRTFEAVKESWNSGHKSGAKRIFLSKTAYNGLWRVNAKEKFNVGWNKTTEFSGPSPDTLLKISMALQKATLLTCEWSDIKVLPDSLVYLDPPYDGDFGSYTGKKWTKDSTTALIKWARGVRTHSRVIQSSSDTSLVRSSLTTETVIELTRNQCIGASGRGLKKELLFY